ncbi:MAG TPA: DUF6508 domain-containing protein [Bacteroidales bacterium]|nr:DUF6508 domain-containing protein [Bacteroidales bacterium]
MDRKVARNPLLHIASTVIAHAQKQTTMILDENNFYETINSLSKKDWRPLLDLIPKIEKVGKFGDNTKAMKLLEQGILVMDPYVEHPIVQQFRDLVYSIPVIIDFNWGKWDEGRRIVSDEDFDYDSINILTKCKIITAIVRNDRFCSGRLVEAFESGMILKILISIRKQLKFDDL